MQALNYFLPQPPVAFDAKIASDFDDLLNQTPPGSHVDYRLDNPKWQFLSYLCSANHLVLHGSPDPAIEVVEPRKAVDVKAFSDQEAIYATTDGIWAIFYAIVDRKRFPQISLFNSCVHIRIPPGQTIGPLFFFSITHPILMLNPWCGGTVYILSRENFIQEPPTQILGAEVSFPHWISGAPARPVARLAVQPNDFPFLAKVHGHDDVKLAQMAAEDPGGFPWAKALVS